MSEKIEQIEEFAREMMGERIARELISFQQGLIRQLENEIKRWVK